VSKLGGEGEGDVGGYPMVELIKREGVEVVEEGGGEGCGSGWGEGGGAELSKTFRLRAHS
jgi:hypothetical protein